MITLKRFLTPIILLPLMTACSNHSQLKTVEYVDLQKFMGDWYVIASIPTRFEKGAHNAVENYSLIDKDKVATTFTYNQDSFSGPLKEMTPKGFVQPDSGNAVWGMQFIWPIKADYRIVYLDEQYRFTIIGRNKRDYVWIMARDPIITSEDYQQLITFVDQIGYDINKIQRVPQQPLKERQ